MPGAESPGPCSSLPLLPRALQRLGPRPPGAVVSAVTSWSHPALPAMTCFQLGVGKCLEQPVHMYVHAHTYAHKYAHTHELACTRTNVHIREQAPVCACVREHMCAHMCTHAHTHAHTRAHIRAGTYTKACTRTQTCMHTHTNVHAHAHTQACTHALDKKWSGWALSGLLPGHWGLGFLGRSSWSLGCKEITPQPMGVAAS